ncbi:MAG: Dabb family protein [Thiolinea sp.]
MIRHCVLIRFKPEVTTAERAQHYQAIQALREHLPGWLDFVCGDNVTLEPGMDKGFNGGFSIDFADAAARDAYLNDPAHQRAGAGLVAAAVEGIDGIVVFDWNHSGF